MEKIRHFERMVTVVFQGLTKKIRWIFVFVKSRVGTFVCRQVLSRPDVQCQSRTEGSFVRISRIDAVLGMQISASLSLLYELRPIPVVFARSVSISHQQQSHYSHLDNGKAIFSNYLS